MASPKLFPLLVILCVFSCFCFPLRATDVSYDGRAIKIDGERRILLSGSIHYPRSTAEMWPDLIKKSKDGGLNAIETYVFWNAHEPRRREYDFSGNLDLIRFLKTIQYEGLYAVLRIGPYVCAEWNYGGFPVWLHNMENVEFRTKNSVFMNEMQIFTTLIVDMVKKEKLFASQGGPIILAQIENEYGNVIGSYGDAGKSYIQWCGDMAESQNIGVPWIMCQESDAPDPMINTCNGWYCDQFKPNRPTIPKMWTENWTGWFKDWGGRDPHRTAEDLAFSVARFFQLGGTFQNYYMYHGGTNFGRTAGGPYIATSYDYDAPLDEYGNLNQPKWGHLKELHLLLKSMEKVLTHGDVATTDFGHDTWGTMYTFDGTSSCFVANKDAKTDATITFQGNQHFVPAWSVSILPDCKKEAYNTAKVNTQTTVMVKKPNNAENEPMSLSWSWRAEDIQKTATHGLGDLSVNQLLDQKVVASDASDYVWYMTRVKFYKHDPLRNKKVTLRVNTKGHVLHAFVHGKYIGSQWATNGDFNFVFEKEIDLKHRENHISLLSVTVGLQNYGAKFDSIATGILGPVELIGNKNGEHVTKDLSSSKWTYKVGLDGEEKQLHKLESFHTQSWRSYALPIKRLLTWYKTTFEAPLGTEPVVVDLQGMSKGHAWVNGNSIGRYWPSFLAQENGCSDSCNYRGSYNNNKCVSNCGNPTQRWYHIPRSFLHDGKNTLILFEEIGGNPLQINFQTVTVGTAHGNVYEGKTLELSCQGGRNISDIRFASFGDPQGSYGSFEKGSCEASNSLSFVQKACIGRESCSIGVSEGTFGSNNCGSNITKRLAVEAVC